jgi:hypothetical protein
MAGSFMVSNPEQMEHWRRVAYVYLVVTAISGLLAFIIAVALYRLRATSSPEKIASRTT